MSSTNIVGLSLAGAVIAAVAFAQPAKPVASSGAAPPTVTRTTSDFRGVHVMLNAKELKWGEAPPGLPKGAKVAVLEGDPAKAGPFTLRIEMPPKYKIMPHWHPAIEHVTVVSGELFMGSGETFDESQATKLTAGGFAVMPIEHAHFAFTKGAKATVQLHGIGPWGITYINPADDPRNAQAAPAAAPASK